jgi:WD40 repeat protein
LGSGESVVSTSELSIASRLQSGELDAGDDTESGLPAPLTDLPPAPAGWWNAAPAPTWADKVLGESELRLLARVGIGIGLSQPGGRTHTFDPQEVRALAYVVPSGRLVVGTSSGQLHLWDAAAHQSVSLVGKHNAGIASVAYHPSGGLVSGDTAGTVISWDIRSGQMLATRSFDGPIGSVRWAQDGSQLAVMVGDWTSNLPTHRLHLLDAERLETQHTLALPATIAVVAHDAQSGWLAVDWSGLVWSLSERRVVDRLEKELVSGAVMCQDLFPITASGESESKSGMTANALRAH